MKVLFRESVIAGVERITAHTSLLDSINVFPVADGDTGTNMSASLATLHGEWSDPKTVSNQLLLSARGNSGNISSFFFSGFLAEAPESDIVRAVEQGRDMAYKAVHKPLKGTMLTFFDMLLESLHKEEGVLGSESVLRIIENLKKSVAETSEILPSLKKAGVVDSGALGMFIFFEIFLLKMSDQLNHLSDIYTVFNDLLVIRNISDEMVSEGHCIDFIAKFDRNNSELMDLIENEGESATVFSENQYIKVHLHTSSKDQLREKIDSCATIVKWSDDDLDMQTRHFRKQKEQCKNVHIMTDAAGSLTVEDSRNLGFTLLNSYINIDGGMMAETSCSPGDVYRAMRDGKKVSTSQASLFEKHQCYYNACRIFDNVIYLSVGSAFTGNYDTAREWRDTNDPDNRFRVIDSTAASGRLALIVIAVVRFTEKTDDPDRVENYAKHIIPNSHEFVFLDKLEYLAAGGRLSKRSAFFGDMLKMKPVVSPEVTGAKKVAVVRNRNEQLEFAFKKLREHNGGDSAPLVMIEYSDNEEWVRGTVKSKIEAEFPGSEIIIQPLSLTSGAHMGPGTWALAFIPEDKLKVDFL